MGRSGGPAISKPCDRTDGECRAVPLSGPPCPAAHVACRTVRGYVSLLLLLLIKDFGEE